MLENALFTTCPALSTIIPATANHWQVASLFIATTKKSAEAKRRWSTIHQSTPGFANVQLRSHQKEVETTDSTSVAKLTWSLSMPRSSRAQAHVPELSRMWNEELGLMSGAGRILCRSRGNIKGHVTGETRFTRNFTAALWKTNRMGRHTNVEGSMQPYTRTKATMALQTYVRATWSRSKAHVEHKETSDELTFLDHMSKKLTMRRWWREARCARQFVFWRSHKGTPMAVCETRARSRRMRWGFEFPHLFCGAVH